MAGYTVEQSGAFMETFRMAPTASGPLSGLSFAVKDLIDVAGRKTGCGNPTWLNTHPPAAVSAVCVEELLAAGAECVGKTITDEVAFSLIGRNHFYGTPLNPAAPDRVPGGSSNGSASAVACGLADFALGTDTGGSVRVPANNCGLWGLRPTHGRISVAGVMPFSPGFDTVGILARDATVLGASAAALLAEEPRFTPPRSLHLVSEAFALAEPAIRAALEPAIGRLREHFGQAVHPSSLVDLCQDRDAGNLMRWREVYSTLQWAEVGSCLGAWIAESKPQFGPATTASFELVHSLDRTGILAAARVRERFCRGLQRTLADGDILCIPTAPTLPPYKDDFTIVRTGDFYIRTLAMTSIAGLARLPQITIPVTTIDGVPVGLSLIGAVGEDLNLVHLGASLFAHSPCSEARS